MKAKIIGFLFILASIVCVFVNFGLWHFIGFFSGFGVLFDVAWFWNPLSLLTSSIVGYVPAIPYLDSAFVVDGVTAILNYGFALLYTILLFAIGKVLLFHKPKHHFPIL